MSFKNHQIGNFITGTTFMTLFHVSSLFAAFFAMSATQPQYVWQDLDKRSKSRNKDYHSMKGNTIKVQNQHSLKSYQVEHMIKLSKTEFFLILKVS